ncbi:MAG: hypothetical protein OES13_10540 [Acidimicrobiia bacterium]|nr:hypothetical protein [Acidimicrobiia bacterium]
MLKLRFLTIVAVLVLVAAACGDSGSTLTDDTTAAPTGDTSASADTTAATSGDTAPPATSGDTLPPLTVGNIPGLSDDCQALANVFLSFSGIFLGGEAPDLNLDAIGDLPSELQADAAMMVAGLQAYADGLADLGVDLTDPASFAALTEDQQQAFGDLADSIDTEEFNAAADRLSAYGEVECAEFVNG